MRQHGCTHPLGVVIELCRKSVEILLPPLQSTFREQIADALEVLGLVLQILFDLNIPRPGQRRVAKPLRQPVAEQLRDGLIATGGADIAFQAQQCGALPLLCDSRIQQSVEPQEQRLRKIEVRHHQAPVQFDRRAVALAGVDQNLQILPHPRVGCRG